MIAKLFTGKNIFRIILIFFLYVTLNFWISHHGYGGTIEELLLEYLVIILIGLILYTFKRD